MTHGQDHADAERRIAAAEIDRQRQRGREHERVLEMETEPEHERRVRIRCKLGAIAIRSNERTSQLRERDAAEWDDMESSVGRKYESDGAADLEDRAVEIC